jgi:hypothetical protein
VRLCEEALYLIKLLRVLYYAWLYQLGCQA